MKATASQIAGAVLKNMISFYMQTFLKTALIIVLLHSQSSLAADKMTVKSAPPPEVEVEDVPLVPVSGVRKDATGEPAKPADTQEKFVLNGYSAGLVIYNQSYSAKVIANFDSTPSSVSSSTADLQNIGILGRYSVIPVGALGTDFALTLASSVNHSSAGLSQVFTTRFEMNLGWGFVTAKNLNY